MRRAAAMRFIEATAVEERVRSDVEHSHEQRPALTAQIFDACRDGSHHYAVARCAPSRKHWKLEYNQRSEELGASRAFRAAFRSSAP